MDKLGHLTILNILMFGFPLVWNMQLYFLWKQMINITIGVLLW